MEDPEIPKVASEHLGPQPLPEITVIAIVPGYIRKRFLSFYKNVKLHIIFFSQKYIVFKMNKKDSLSDRGDFS